MQAPCTPQQQPAEQAEPGAAGWLCRLRLALHRLQPAQVSSLGKGLAAHWQAWAVCCQRDKGCHMPSRLHACVLPHYLAYFPSSRLTRQQMFLPSVPSGTRTFTARWTTGLAAAPPACAPPPSSTPPPARCAHADSLAGMPPIGRHAMPLLALQAMRCWGGLLLVASTRCRCGVECSSFTGR